MTAFRRAAWRAFLLCAAIALAAPAHADKGDAFQPKPQGTVNVAVDTSGENVAVSVHGQVRVFNSGSVVAFCRIETGTTAASASTDFPVVPGVVEVFTGVGDHLACITSSGTTTIYATPGGGL